MPNRFRFLGSKRLQSRRLFWQAKHGDLRLTKRAEVASGLTPLARTGWVCHGEQGMAILFVKVQIPMSKQIRMTKSKILNVSRTGIWCLRFEVFLRTGVVPLVSTPGGDELQHYICTLSQGRGLSLPAPITRAVDAAAHSPTPLSGSP
jgi:hypothetical protein